MTSEKIAKDTEVCPEDSLRYASPLLLGRIYDLTGSYTHILSILSAITAVAALAMLTLAAYRFTEQLSSLADAEVKPLLNAETGAAFESN